MAVFGHVVAGMAPVLAMLAAAACVDISIGDRAFACSSPTDPSCGPGCACEAAPAGTVYRWWCRCDGGPDGGPDTGRMDAVGDGVAADPGRDAGGEPSLTWSQAVERQFEDEVAVTVCLADLACSGTFTESIPDGYGFLDGNTGRLEDCLLANTAPGSDRDARVACVVAHAGDCTSLVPCLAATYAPGVAMGCRDGHAAFHPVTNDSHGFVDCGAVGPGGYCHCIEQGGDGSCLKGDCVVSGPAIGPGCTTVLACTFGMFQTCTVSPDVEGAATLRMPCGEGYSCGVYAPQNGGFGPDVPGCLPAGGDCDRGVRCDGNVLDLCHKNGNHVNAGIAHVRYDCLDHGFAGCGGGMCRW